MAMFSYKMKSVDKPIVIVDDDDELIMITKMGHEASQLVNPVISFSNGESFLNYLNEVIDGKSVHPELVLLDINMPKMNGYQVLEKMRGIWEFKEIPVVFMFTASDSDDDKNKARAKGATGYIRKPNNFSEFIAIFESLKVSAA